MKPHLKSTWKWKRKSLTLIKHSQVPHRGEIVMHESTSVDCEAHAFPQSIAFRSPNLINLWNTKMFRNYFKFTVSNKEIRSVLQTHTHPKKKPPFFFVQQTK